MSYLDGLIVDVDEGERSRVRVSPDGRHAYEAKITMSRDGFEALRQGYLCINCFEDLRPVGAFPKQCPLCGFPVRERQLQHLGMDHVGEEEIGSKLSLSDEMSRLGELWLPES
jgi:hypothetical protein